MYKFESDDLNRGGFITKKDILKFVSEYDIFQFAIGYKPELDKMYYSPFREDKNPGCFFDASNGRLYLIDYGANRKIEGINLFSVDCFHAVMLRFKLFDFNKVLKLLHANLCTGKKVQYNSIQIKSTPKPETIIIPFSRFFDSRDKKYWSQYYISSKNLKEDKVMGVKAYTLRKNKISKSFVSREIAYCYTDFSSGHKKLYFPTIKKDDRHPRFISNCDQNDIGGTSYLPPLGEKLVITKSYKDWRVLKNVGYDCIWLQNEGCYPERLNSYLKRFDKTVIFFDNDDAGIFASKMLKEKLNSTYSDVSEIRVPFINNQVKDPSDYIKHNFLDFKKFINNFL